MSAAAEYRPSGNGQPRRSLWEIGLAAILLAVGVEPKPAGSRPPPRLVPARSSTEDPSASKDATPCFAPDVSAYRRDNSIKNIVLALYNRISEHRVMAIAAGVTFFALLAIFPTLAALVSIYGLFTDPATIGSHLDRLSGFLPGGAMEIIGDQMRRVGEAGKTKLGLTFATSLAISLWSANAGMKALFDALNIVYNAKDTRGFIQLNLISLAFTFGTIIFLLLSIGAIIVLPVLLGYLGLGGITEKLVNIGRWPVMFVIVALMIGLIYRFGPCRKDPKWHWITWGSGLAAIVWIALSLLFSWYATNFGSYNKTYGSLGAAIGFMTWIWLSTMVILAGAEIDDEMEERERLRRGEREGRRQESDPVPAATKPREDFSPLREGGFYVASGIVLALGGIGAATIWLAK
jgi:membrane protein